MQTLPPIDWSIARRFAAPVAGDLPTVERAEAHTLVASLRLAAQRAGELVGTVSGLPGAPAHRVIVSDRATWAHGATRMASTVLEQLPLGAPTGPMRGLRGVGHGALAGIGMGWASRHLLGQFDPVASTLFLLAPNILQLQRARGFVMADFQLWVAAHEQTHAFQFSAAPWLWAHLMERFEVVGLDDVKARDVVRGMVGGHGVIASLASPAARQALQEITAAMTLLEGHADFVSDKVGAKHIPSVRRLRRAFSRTHAPTTLSKLVPAIDKNAQYRDGLRFCRAVSAKKGRKALNRAFEAPEFLPRPDEINDAGAWLRRVHGTT